jgi:uncharacterized protein (TIGR00730 family)
MNAAGPPVAYENESFLDSDDARPLRILAEYLEPMRRFRHARVRDTIVFFGSARLAPDGPLRRYYDDARELARLVTVWSKSMPSHEQQPNPYITRELSFEFHYFFMRKLWFAHLARALVVFPGGFGTLDELMEILTLSQTRKLARRIRVVLYGPGYWNEIVDFDALVRHGMIDPDDLALFHFADNPATALALLQAGLPVEPDEPAPSFTHSQTPGRDEDRSPR